MIGGRLASGYRTIHQAASPRRSSVGFSGWASRAAPPVVSRVYGDRSSVTRDDSARAVVLRDAERARRALWADCERRPIHMDKDVI